MESGKLKTKLVRIEDREWVSKMVQTYKNHKKAVSEVLKLNKKQVDLLRSLIRLSGIFLKALKQFQKYAAEFK